MHLGLSHEKSKQHGIPLKELKRKKKKRGNISSLMRKEDYAQGESE